MIKYELEALTKENFSREVLQVIENICEEYGLEDHFGTISTALMEFGCLLSDHLGESTLNADFLIQTGGLSVTFHSQDMSLDFIYDYFADTNVHTNDSVFTVTLLTDEIEFNQQNQDFTLLFHVKPYMKEMIEGRENTTHHFSKKSDPKEKIEDKINKSSHQ